MLPHITMKAISCLSVLLESIFCIVPILKPYFGEGTITEIAFFCGLKRYQYKQYVASL